MLSGTRLRGSKTKRAQKYTSEEAESILLDADSITVFVENTQDVQGRLRQGRPQKSYSDSSVHDFDALRFQDKQWDTNLRTGVLEERKIHKAAKDPVFLMEDRDPCGMTLSLSRPLSNCESDLFETNFDKVKCENNTRKVSKRLGENLSQTTPEGWMLDHNKTEFKFRDSLGKGVQNYNKHFGGKAVKDDLIFGGKDLDFCDLSKVRDTVFCPEEVKNELKSREKRQPNLRQIRRSQSEKHFKSVSDLFTDFSLSDDKSTGKSALRELPWGKSATGDLPRDESSLRNKHLVESPDGGLDEEKNTVEESILDEESSKEDLSNLMEDSKDLVNEINNSGGDEFTDIQGERSFVCLVDQLTDLRVRQKFAAHYADKRRQAVCEELEKIWVWNDKCLYEHRRDLNIRKALSNMFL